MKGYINNHEIELTPDQSHAIIDGEQIEIQEDQEGQKYIMQNQKAVYFDHFSEPASPTKERPGSFSSLFEQAAQITKAHAYDIVSEQVKELKEENQSLKAANAELLETLRNLWKISTLASESHVFKKELDAAKEAINKYSK